MKAKETFNLYGSITSFIKKYTLQTIIVAFGLIEAPKVFEFADLKEENATLKKQVVRLRVDIVNMKRASEYQYRVNENSNERIINLENMHSCLNVFLNKKTKEDMDNYLYLNKFTLNKKSEVRTTDLTDKESLTE
jgi:predicted nuclease with TOPRIM domain